MSKLLPDLDDLLDAAVLEGALAAGRDPVLAASQFGAARVIAAGAAAGKRAGFGDVWSESEIEVITDQLSELGVEGIAERLGRSLSAVETRRYLLGLPGVTRHPEYITGQGMADALGMDSHSLLKLIDRGVLPVERTPLASDRLVWRMRRTAFYVWATRPENWVYFNRSIRQPDRIRDERLRRLIVRAAAEWGDEWWTIGEAANYHGVAHELLNKYIHQGRLPAVKWGNWWVRRSDAVALRVYSIEDGQLPHRGTTGGDAFLVLAVAVGIPYPHIARMMRRRTDGGVTTRYRALRDRDRIPWLARLYDLPVQYRASDRAAWCDWRDTAYRFPLLTRVWERLKAGDKLGRRERAVLAGVCRAFLNFHVPGHPLAARLVKGDSAAEKLAVVVALYEETV